MRRLSDSDRVPVGFGRDRVCLKTQLAFALVFAGAVTLAQAQDQSATAISREVKDVFEHAAKAVVKVHANDRMGALSGTGFFIDPTGTLYTAYSVGGDAENVTVEFKGKKL